MNGLEPSTSSVTGWRSNQLSYIPGRARIIGDALPLSIGQRGADSEDFADPHSRSQYIIATKTPTPRSEG